MVVGSSPGESSASIGPGEGEGLEAAAGVVVAGGGATGPLYNLQCE